jgi:hypothetical protein
MLFTGINVTESEPDATWFGEYASAYVKLL